MNGHRFHEWPLAVFTTLAIIGAGLLTAPLVAALVGSSASAASVLVPGTALVAAGLAVSLAHLGQPQRSPLALARAGRSRLSNEVVLASITLAAGAFASVLPFLSPVTTLLASLAAIAFLVSLGLVYALPGQLAWRGAAVASPLTLGLGVGTVGLAAAISWNPATAGFPGRATAGVTLVGAAVLAADVVAKFVYRPKAGALRDSGGLLRHSRADGATWLPPIRFLLVDVLPGALLLTGLPKGAVGVLGLGILVDRLSFYLVANQHTTEAEIARVEAVIAGQGEGR
jgi:DMSO reductase anchor subunit